MSDMRARFRTLDYLPDLDIWADAETRATATHTGLRSAGLPVVLVVTLVLAVLGGAAFFASGMPLPVLITTPTASETSSPEPSGVVDLSTIVVTMANRPEGLTVYRSVSGIDALESSDTVPVGSPGFVDAFLTEFDSDDDHDGDHEGHYSTFAASFETAADAQRAFATAVANHEPPDGWGQPRQLDVDPPLGDQSVQLVTGRDYGFPRLSVLIWRVDTVVLQAVDWHPYDDPDLLLSIAEDMTARATGN